MNLIRMINLNIPLNLTLHIQTGATIPDDYYKTIKYGKITERYYFKNEKPESGDYSKYRIK